MKKITTKSTRFDKEVRAEKPKRILKSKPKFDKKTKYDKPERPEPKAPAKKNKPSNTVYVSNLSYDRDRNGLKSLFSRYGSIKKIKIIVEPTTQQSRGMAFVEMGSIEEATRAIEGLTGAVIDGRNIKANYAIPEREENKRSMKVDPTEKPKKAVEKDLDYKSIQLAKKARNDAKRKSNPFIFKKATKKKV